MNFPALNFDSPVIATGASALDGNKVANRISITNVVLSGVTVPPGNEFFSPLAGCG
jgi:hypothetical protein